MYYSARLYSVLIVRCMFPILQTLCLIVPCVLIFHQPPPCALYHEERICAVKQIVRRAALILVLLCCATGLQRAGSSIPSPTPAALLVALFCSFPSFLFSTERIHRQTVPLFPTSPIGQNALSVLIDFLLTLKQIDRTIISSYPLSSFVAAVMFNFWECLWYQCIPIAQLGCNEMKWNEMILILLLL